MSGAWCGVGVRQNSYPGVEIQESACVAFSPGLDVAASRFGFGSSISHCQRSAFGVLSKPLLAQVFLLSVFLFQLYFAQI